ncbi:MAG: hypothetical protein A2X93_04710 [Deltaproteobacteria bacterium GWC2_56_8]|nr:MAG: hypothetical protein A2X93_04710 [Deltaproteobacteria bacterium GWC2_56_8]
MTVWTDYGSMAAQVDSWAGKSPVGSCLNAGELADSLAFGDYSLEMLKTVLPVLSRYPGRELYLLTKSTGEVLDGLKPESFVTVGFSVNAEEVGAAYEKGAPLPSERLAGAKRLRDRGWRIKIRLDPMIPVDGWERAYGDVIRLINELAPEKVTLGSLRFNPSLPGFCPKSDIWRFASERESGGKLRIDEKTSLAMYRFALERLEPKVTSVCKESPLIWKGLGPGRLNCVCLA